jgi:hypothetical protein
MPKPNETPYDIRVWIYPGADPAGTPTTWGIPLDISAYVRHPGNDGGAPIVYTVGRGDEAAQVDASTMSLTLDNRTGLFSTKNVAGALYGKIRRNTPIVMGQVCGYDSFNRTTVGTIGTSESGQTWTFGSFWTCDGANLVHTTTAANQASYATMNEGGSADFDMTFTASATAATTGGPVVASAIQRVPASGDSVLFKLNFQPAGVLETQIQRQSVGPGGNVSSSVTTVAGGWAANDVWNVRAQRTGADVRLKVWKVATSEPATWSTVWSEPYLRSGELGLHGWRQSTNTNAGNYVLKFDALRIISLEYTGNVVQWPVRWDKRGDNSWAPIQAAGILRRLQQGKGPIKSPLTSQLGAYNPTGWWTLEDAAGSTSFASQVLGGGVAYSSGVTAAGDNSLPGSGPCPTLSATNGVIRGKTNNRLKVGLGTITGFSAMFFTKFAGGMPTSKTAVATITAWGGGAPTWQLSVDANNYWMEALNLDGGVISSKVNAFAQDPSQWIAWQLETSTVGGITTWSSISHQVGNVDYFAQTDSFAMTGYPLSAVGFTLGGSNLPTGTAFSQVWLGENTLPFVTDSFSLVSNGYLGETAGDRLTRVCQDNGIPFALEPGTTDLVGAQPIAKVFDVLKQAADADGGILYEAGNGLGYRPRSARYRQAVELPLSVAAGQIDDPPEPIDDDQRYRNKWTVTNDGGSFAVVQDDAEIAANGLYEDSATLVLYSDDYALLQAGWRLYLGTWPDLRWPGLSINLARNPSLVATWRKCRYGPRMTVATGLLQVQGSDPDVIVEGYTATLWPGGWAIGMNCSTAKVWDINTLDDDLERLDATSSTVATALGTTTGTSLVVSNNGDPWSTWAPTSQFPTEVPFTILLNGETMSVTNVGDLSGNNQTLTVVRGTNGGAKTHVVGETVSLAFPMIIAL